MPMNNKTKKPRGPDKKPRKQRGPTVDTAAKRQRAKDLTENHGLSLGEAGKVMGLSKGRIHQLIQGQIDPKAVAAWKEKKADLMEMVQAEMLLSLDLPTIKDLVSRRGLVDYGILFDKSQIQRGEATEIVDFRGFLEHSLTELADRRRALEGQLKGQSDTYDIETSDYLSLDAADGQAKQAADREGDCLQTEGKEAEPEGGPTGPPVGAAAPKPMS